MKLEPGQIVYENAADYLDGYDDVKDVDTAYVVVRDGREGHDGQLRVVPLVVTPDANCRIYAPPVDELDLYPTQEEAIRAGMAELTKRHEEWLGAVKRFEQQLSGEDSF